MEFLSILIIFCAFAALIYVFLKRWVHYWKRRNVPYIQPTIFYGNSRGLGKEFFLNEFVKRMYLQLKPLGPVGGLFVFIRRVAIINDLDLVKTILVKDFNIFSNRGTYSNEKDDPLSGNLVNLEDDSWRQLRQKITPTFTSGKIKMMFATIDEISDRLITTIEKETVETGQLEVKGILSRFTTDVIGSAAFGLECNSLDDKNTLFYQTGLKVFADSNIVKRIFMMTFMNLARIFRMTTTREEVADFYISVIKNTMKYRDENPQVQRNDFINLLMKLGDAGELTFNQIAAQSVVFFLAGKLLIFK